MKFPVKVQVSFHRTQKYYSTGKDLTHDEWAKLATAKGHTLKSIREDVEKSFSIVKKAVEDLASRGFFSFNSLNNRLKSASCDTMNIAFKAKIAELRNNDQIGNMMIYDNVLKGLERFAGDRIRFDSVTPEWLRRYERFLRNEQKSAVSISIHMRTLRAIFNSAKRAGYVKESQYPFGTDKYTVQAGEGRKMALTLEQIGQIARYDDGSRATERYRDFWLFLYLANGINVADFVKLKHSNIENGEIYYIRQKTERTARSSKEIRVVITDAMQSIINKWGNRWGVDAYLFPILTGKEDAMTAKQKTKYLTRAINKRMAGIGEKLGIGNISTYTARHSFATVLKRSGANIAYISESLGHSDLRTTENYLASFEKEERIKNAELLTKF
jgi:integrase